jgi:hypothetical protein
MPSHALPWIVSTNSKLYRFYPPDQVRSLPRVRHRILAFIPYTVQLAIIVGCVKHGLAAVFE